MSSVLFGLGGFLAGVGLALFALRVRLRAALVPSPAPPEPRTPLPVEGAPEPAAQPAVLGLVERALREPLARLRRSTETPAASLARLDHLAAQLRMLSARPRPMQARPTSPIALLEEAAAEVEPLRLGKVPASWALRCRQPVHLDAERGRAAFREILAAVAEAAGPGGRLGIRIVPGDDAGYPVRVEVEVGRRGAEPDALPLLVARHLLEGQGARVICEGPHVHVSLRSVPADLAPSEPVDSASPQTSSNR